MLILSRDGYTTAPAHTAAHMLPSSPRFPIPVGIASRADARQDKTGAWNSSRSLGASSESDLGRGHNRSWLRPSAVRRPSSGRGTSGCRAGTVKDLSLRGKVQEGSTVGINPQHTDFGQGEGSLSSHTQTPHCY